MLEDLAECVRNQRIAPSASALARAKARELAARNRWQYAFGVVLVLAGIAVPVIAALFVRGDIGRDQALTWVVIGAVAWWLAFIGLLVAGRQRKRSRGVSERVRRGLRQLELPTEEPMLLD